MILPEKIWWDDIGHGTIMSSTGICDAKYSFSVTKKVFFPFWKLVIIFWNSIWLYFVLLSSPLLSSTQPHYFWVANDCSVMEAIPYRWFKIRVSEYFVSETQRGKNWVSRFLVSVSQIRVSGFCQFEYNLNSIWECYQVEFKISAHKIHQND